MTIEVKNITNLIYSKQFEELNRMFKAFNPLKVLRMDSHEIRHSNVLAWLLNHEENHGLNSVFIEKLISRLVMKPENDRFVSDSRFFLKTLAMKHVDWKVEREKLTTKKRYIDLLLTSEENETVIIIENKFYSSQSEKQLDDYLEYVKNEYEGFTIIPVFLTLLNEEPANDQYWALNYTDIAEVLEFVLKFYKESISGEVFVFLKNYLSILQERFAPDEERLMLAEEIFEQYGEAITYLYLLNNPGIKFLNHHQPFKAQLETIGEEEEQWMKKIYTASNEAIDFIYTEGSLVLKKAFQRFVQKNNQLDIQLYDASKSYPSFIYPEWHRYADFLKNINDKAVYWLKYGLIIFMHRVGSERLQLIIEVGNMEFDHRIKLLEKLEDNGFSIKPSSKTPNSMYTRIFTDQVEVTDWTSIEVVQKAIHKLKASKKFEDHISRINKSIAAASEELGYEPIDLKMIEAKDLS
ncbi:PD-(D/E)XK nuclease family protein [Planomicrobium chinense]|uniref:PDDEXK-like family protein n=1 Tax=Planococcus chinensis TaxID=272917 RepID=UPI001CC55021|nr:PD-(D/E)XK nuclease family protein [Planococcus chinensis]MBZ5201987.1 PD-(D/E)XK nuclease family protein [Planococcus chinensis]